MSDPVLLHFRIQPNAQKNQLSEILADGRIKVKIQAPPVEGKANKALKQFLGEMFGLKGTAIKIVRGETGRDKDILLEGISFEGAMDIIQRHLTG